MKALFWIFTIGSVITAINALTGYNEYNFGTSGASATKATILERMLNALLCLILAVGAYGIKEKKEYGWWIGNALYFLVGIGFLANIRFGLGKDIGYSIWTILSQAGCAALTYYSWLKWWIPKRVSYFEQIEPAEQVASRNPDKPVS